MSHWLICLFLASVCSCDTFNFTVAPGNIKCSNVQNVNIEKGGYQYCKCSYKEFGRYYSKAGLKLTSFLENLRVWNCSQFKDECEKRRFVFNRFTFLVYEKFCNNSNFVKICRKELNTLHSNTNNATSRISGMYFNLVRFLM